MRDIGGLFVGLIVAAVTAPGCGRTDEASGADVRFVVDEAKTDAYIASLDLAAFERAGTDFTSPMHDPTRIGKALDEIDPSGECDHAQLAAIERRLDGVDRRRVLEHIFRLATHDATTNTERHLALLKFMHRASYHCRYLRPMYPDGTRCWDPLVSLEMGEMHCTHAARLAVDLWEAGGFDARCVNFGSHSSAEVFYDGDWHYFGADSVGGNGLSLFKADGTIPSWKELSEKPEWIDTLPYRYELNNRGTPRVAGTPVRSSHCFHEQGGGEPMYHAKRRPAVPGEFNYGWAQEQTFPPDWVMADAPERFQPGVVEFRRIDVAPASPGRVVATLEWTVRDRDEDVRGFRVYVSSTSRGWDYSKFAGTREAQRFWSITTGWRPEMYDALNTMPPSDLDVITTTTGSGRNRDGRRRGPVRDDHGVRRLSRADRQDDVSPVERDPARRGISRPTNPQFPVARRPSGPDTRGLITEIPMRIPASALIVALIAFVTVGLAAPAGAGPCDVGDFDADGTIDGTDLATLLAAWNEPGGPADLDEGGDVGSEDLAILLANWGEQAVLAGTFPAMWINGGACGFDPEIQVHQYNEHTYILRQSLCTNFEGPFMYLLFGEDTVLMQDTGAGGGIHIGDTVYGIIAAWLEAHERTSIDLVVTHSHGHGDHVQGDSQFIGQPNTTVVGISQSAVASFFGISNWPTQIVEYDLGGRIIDVIPIPGHQSAHIALYDRATGILFTGDTLYPGRLYISNFAQYVASIGRMVDFTADKPTCHVLGTHIEMTNTPGVDFNFGATFHPDEHPLQLGREHLVELHDAVVAMNGSPQYEVHDDFIIFPLGLAGPAADAGGDDCARPHTEAAYRAMLRAAARLKPAPRLEGGPSGLGAGVARVYFRQRARKVGG